MGFVLKKRGKRASIIHELLFYIFQLGMVVVIMLSLIFYVNNLADNLEFEQRFTSIDLALLSTALFFSPGNVKHSYSPLLFYSSREKAFSPTEALFGNSEVIIRAVGEQVQKAYWHLSDATIRPFVATQRIDGVLREFEAWGFELKRPAARNLTFYRSGFQVAFDERQTNAYQLFCPVLNTSFATWQSKKVFVGRVNAKDSDPSGRIIGVLDSQFSEFTSANVGGSGSGIPKDHPAVVLIGDSGVKRDAGSLVVYIPIDKDSLKARKLACLIINHLLTSDSSVLYAQIMPVDSEWVAKNSPLKVFGEKHDGQVVVFLDLSSFSEEQIDVRNSAGAIKNAVQDYFGGKKESVVGYTISVSGAMRSALDKPVPDQVASAPSPSSPYQEVSAPAGSACPSGNVVALGDSITYHGENQAYGYLKVLKTQCSSVDFKGFGYPGKESGGILSNFDTAVSSGSYKEIIVFAGVNDLRAGKSAESIQGNLEQIYSKAKAKGLRVVAVTILPWKGHVDSSDPSKNWNAQKQAETEKLNRWILSKPSNVDSVVNIYSTLAGSDPAQMKREYHVGDNLHPFRDGHKVIAESISGSGFSGSQVIASAPGQGSSPSGSGGVASG